MIHIVYHIYVGFIANVHLKLSHVLIKSEPPVLT